MTWWFSKQWIYSFIHEAVFRQDVASACVCQPSSFILYASAWRKSRAAALYVKWERNMYLLEGLWPLRCRVGALGWGRSWVLGLQTLLSGDLDSVWLGRHSRNMSLARPRDGYVVQFPACLQLEACLALLQSPAWKAHPVTHWRHTLPHTHIVLILFLVSCFCNHI